jgi:NAD(P)-dependent dehydrogenase (short-subunit alcohol dehydrogenase family)
MAADLGGTGITANVIQPGSTDTALLQRSAEIYDLDDPAELAIHHLDQRVLAPAEIAAAVVWLCSRDAAAVTGTALPVDGGMTAT